MLLHLSQKFCSQCILHVLGDIQFWSHKGQIPLVPSVFILMVGDVEETRPLNVTILSSIDGQRPVV